MLALALAVTAISAAPVPNPIPLTWFRYRTAFVVIGGLRATTQETSGSRPALPINEFRGRAAT
jgi:hypothetical protein